jgi:RimJ/RimL family protein N-acetyltransferase
MEAPVLQGRRVTLTPLRLSDAGALVELEDYELRRWYQRKTPMTIDRAERYIEEAASAWRGETDARKTWAVRFEADGDLVGVVEVWQKKGVQSYYTGLWIGGRFRRAGVGSDALRCVITYAFQVERWPWLQAQIEPDNEASLALARSIGFTLSGRGWRLGDGAEVHEYRLDPVRFARPD